MTHQESLTMTPTEHGHPGADGEDGHDPASNRSKSVAEIQATYADAADWIHRFEFVDRLLTGRFRRDRFCDLAGRVLDVACGTGTSFRYLPADVDLVGIDISPEMLAKARKRQADLGLDATLHRMDAEALEFQADSFDAVISALSTCTFPDPVAALREMDRVCAPDGTIRLVEHGRSSVGPIARFQEWRADAHFEKMGCRWTQEPLDVVEAAGLEVVDLDRGRLGMITSMTVTATGGGPG